MSDETTLRETLAEHGYQHGWLCECGWVGDRDDHVAHLEAVVLAWVGARLAGADVREAVWQGIRGESTQAGATSGAIDALCDALGVPVAPNSASVDPNPTSTLAAEFDRSNDTDGICDPGCPLLGCPDCPTEASNRDHQEAK